MGGGSRRFWGGVFLNWSLGGDWWGRCGEVIGRKGGVTKKARRSRGTPTQKHLARLLMAGGKEGIFLRGVHGGELLKKVNKWEGPRRGRDCIKKKKGGGEKKPGEASASSPEKRVPQRPFGRGGGGRAPGGGERN